MSKANVLYSEVSYLYTTQITTRTKLDIINSRARINNFLTEITTMRQLPLAN